MNSYEEIINKIDDLINYLKEKKEYSSVYIQIEKKYKVEDLVGSRRGVKTYKDDFDFEYEAEDFLKDLIENNPHLEGLVGIEDYYEIIINNSFRYCI